MKRCRSRGTVKLAKAKAKAKAKAGRVAVVPLIGTGLHLVLVYIQRVFDLFAWGMFIYLVILRRRA